MLLILLIFVTLMIYIAFKIPRKLKQRQELKKIEQEKIIAKIRAENFKKKVKRARNLKS